MTESKSITVRDVMGQAYVLVDGLITVAEAVRLMREREATTLLVDKRDASDEYGIVLAKDIASQVVAKNRSLDRTNVYEIMSKPVLFVRPRMDIKYCARFFQRFGISTAPVIDHGKILGVVSFTNLVLEGLERPE